MNNAAPAQMRYSRIAMSLHWGMAALLAPMLFFGGDLIRAANGSILPTLHASAGLTVLLLAIARIWWRLSNPPPEMPPETPSWERMSAKATHALLYVLMIAIPVSGALAYSSFAVEHPSASAATFLGILPIPGFGVLPALPAGDIHGLLVNLMIGLVALHVLAALKHQFVSHNGLLWRMLPL